MNHYVIEFEFDKPTLGFLVLKYEFTISRYKDSDDTGRKWWVPRYTHGLVSADFTLPSGKPFGDWTFKSGKEMDGRIKKVMRELDAEIWEAIEEKVKELVNSPTYEDNPHASDPKED